MRAKVKLKFLPNMLMIIMIMIVFFSPFLHEQLSIESTHNRYIIISISTGDQLPFGTRRKLSTTHYNQQSTTRFNEADS